MVQIWNERPEEARTRESKLERRYETLKHRFALLDLEDSILVNHEELKTVKFYEKYPRISRELRF